MACRAAIVQSGAFLPEEDRLALSPTSGRADNITTSTLAHGPPPALANKGGRRGMSQVRPPLPPLSTPCVCRTLLCLEGHMKSRTWALTSKDLGIEAKRGFKACCDNAVHCAKVIAVWKVWMLASPHCSLGPESNFHAAFIAERCTRRHQRC